LTFRDFLARFAGQPVTAAVGAMTGWRFVLEECQRAGVDVRATDPTQTSAKRDRKRRAKTDRLEARLLLELLVEDRLPESWALLPLRFAFVVGSVCAEFGLGAPRRGCVARAASASTPACGDTGRGRVRRRVRAAIGGSGALPTADLARRPGAGRRGGVVWLPIDQWGRRGESRRPRGTEAKAPMQANPSEPRYVGSVTADRGEHIDVYATGEPVELGEGEYTVLGRDVLMRVNTAAIAISVELSAAKAVNLAALLLTFPSEEDS
jgi:hypothetical protein